MSTTLRALGLDHMTRDERLKLVQELWDSIAAETSSPLLNDAQRMELERRIAEDDATPDDVVPWEQVKAKTQSRLQS